MTDEISLNAFGPAWPEHPTENISAPDPDQKTADVLDAIEAEKQRLRQMTLEGTEEPVKNVTPARGYVRAIFYASRTDGEGHVVTLHQTKEGPGLLCTCPASRNLSTRPKGCWAMQDARDALGMPAVEG